MVIKMNVGSISSVSNTELFKIISGYNVKEVDDNAEIRDEINGDSNISNKKYITIYLSIAMKHLQKLKLIMIP